ncbi:hypothetical protein ACFVMC_00890 [Nocardia sp. NPDC127579]
MTDRDIRELKSRGHDEHQVALLADSGLTLRIVIRRRELPK